YEIDDVIKKTRLCPGKQQGKVKECQRCGTNASPGSLFFYEKTGQSGMKKTHESTKILCEQ
ncbi:MAG: hypothetical protein ACLSV6_09970, partial [Butyricicoccus sp.]